MQWPCMRYEQSYCFHGGSDSLGQRGYLTLIVVRVDTVADTVWVTHLPLPES